MTEKCDTEYSQASFDQMIITRDEWIELFEKSAEFLDLTDLQKEDAQFAINIFSEMAYNYHLQKPTQWTGWVVEDVCLSLMPRKVSDEPAFFEKIEPILTSFFNFLKAHKLHDNADALNKAVKGLGPDIVKAAQDKSNWGMAKSFAMGAKKDGVDIADDRQMQLAVMQHNLRSTAENYMRDEMPKIGRNDPCPCGSGKKFKKCCAN